MPTTPRIGSLFTGTGALDMAAQAVFGGEVAWHCQYDPEDKHQFAAHMLAYHWPGLPNLGDITAVDWQEVLDDYGPVDILTGGFPCTDLSLAGDQAGLFEGTRSGLWLHMARAIRVLRPSIVIIENVRGLLSAPAHSDVEPCSWCLGDAGGEPPLRALGAVLADLAELGLDAEWVGLPASSIGAPHERWREFILAWPADGAAAEDSDVAVGDQRRFAASGQAESRGSRSDVGGRGGAPAAHAEAVADAEGVGHRDAWPSGVGGLPAAAVAGGSAAAFGADDAASDAAGFGWREGGAEPTGLGRGSDAPVGSGTDWGQFEPAIRRWEAVLGQSAPRPVDDRGRLSPELPEWMMGLPAGHITAVPAPPGMSASQLRNAQLKAAGNGVVKQQAEAALRLLLARVSSAAAAA